MKLRKFRATMNSKLVEHLRGRPIAPVLNATIGSNTNLLKILCILDYELEKANMYPEIKVMPKLMGQLMNFYPSSEFKYFKYNLSKEAKIGNKVLQCKCCELIGPYVIVLEHMAVNHNIHTSAKLCMFCEKDELQDHATSNTLDQCYDNYMTKKQLH